MNDDQHVPALVLSSRFGSFGSFFKRVISRVLRFWISYQAYVNAWLNGRVIGVERRADRLEADVAEMRALVTQLRIALPQSLSRLQLAIDACAQQIERAHDDDLLLELAGVQRALGELENRLASLEDSGAGDRDGGRALPWTGERKRLSPAPSEPVRALGVADARERDEGLFPDAFRRPPQPLGPLGESVRIETGGANGARREP
jgi:hypothetical protein